MDSAMLRLEPSVSVELCAPDQLLTGIKLHVQVPIVTAGKSMGSMGPEEFDRFIREETFGSTRSKRDIFSSDPPDHYRFGRSDGLLSQLFLEILDRTPEDQDRVSRWLAAERVPGSLRLVAPQSEFRVELAEKRWISDRELVMLRGGREAEAAERLRVEVAPGLQLLFADTLLTGWILENPERHIYPGFDVPSQSPPDPELGRVLADFWNLVAYPDGADRLLEDPGMRDDLEALIARLALDGGATERRDPLREVIQDVIDNWYLPKKPPTTSRSSRRTCPKRTPSQQLKRQMRYLRGHTSMRSAGNIENCRDPISESDGMPVACPIGQ
jgi:hypothetical protein